MNVLISGAGLLGTHIAKCLADYGASVTIIDINPDEEYCCRILGDQRNRIEIQAISILDESSLDAILLKSKINYIVHSAALFDPKWHYRDDLLKVNVIGTELLLKKAVQYGIIRFIFISTVSVYNFRKRPSEEVEETFSIEPQPRCIYGATKALGEAIGGFFTVRHHLNFVSARFSNLYGPNRHIEPHLKSVWQQVFDRAIQEGVINLDYPQMHRNQYLFVKDAAEAIKQMLAAKQLNYEVYNLASKELYDMQDFIRVAKSHLAHIKVIGSQVSCAGYKYGMNCQRAIEDFDFSPQTTFEQGFLNYLEFK